MARCPTRLRLLAAAFAAASGLVPLAAQAPRLLDSVESPMLYVSLGGETAAAATPALGAVPSLLADPALATLLGGEDAGTAGGRALSLVRGLLSRSTGELELALTGVVPASGQPLLLLRLRLQAAETARLRELLDGPELATPSRRLGAHAAYALRSRDAAAEQRPGQRVELALVGQDLFVGNDGTAIEETLAGETATTSASPRRVPLGRDPRFTALREHLETPAGSLLVYGDWQRLRQRWQGDDGPFLLGSSGLGNARTAMATLAPNGKNFSATLLLDFAVEAPAAGAGRTGPRGQRDHGHGAENWIDGWLIAAQSVPARTLLPELPGGGLGGLVLAVDLDDLARRSQRGAGVLHTLHDALREHGLDFDRSVLGRLGTRGSLLLPLSPSPSDTADAEVAMVYALRAKSRKAASDLYDDVRRAVEGRGSGRTVPGRDRRSEVLELRGHGRHRNAPPTFVAVAEDSLLLGLDAEALGRLADDIRRAGRTRSKRDAAVAQAVQSIGGEAVTGLFDLDLQPWFARLARTLAPAGASLDFSAIPQRHTGFLSLQPRDGGMLLRIGVLSAR